MSKNKYTRFEDMSVWQEAQDLAVNVYNLTHAFPKSELYGLVSQLQRAASSVSANIAEGFGRHSAKDKSHFYHIAFGSLLETKNFIYLAARLGYIDQEQSGTIALEAESIQHQISAILKFFKDNA